MQVSQTCLFFLLLLPILAPKTQSLSDPDLIDTTCKQTDNYNLCVTTLNSEPSHAKNSVKDLALISLDVALTNAKNTLNFVGELFRNTRDPVLYRVYGTCIEEYRKAVETHIPAAIDALGNSKGSGASKQGAIDADGDVMTCNTQLVERSPPVTKLNNAVHQLLILASQIISLVK